MLTIKLRNQSNMVKDLLKPYEKVTQEVEQLMSQKTQSMDHVKGIAEIKHREVKSIWQKCGTLLKE